MNDQNQSTSFDKPHRSPRATRILLFLTLLVGFTYIFPRWADWSQNSRLNLTLAIVDHHTLSIDPYFGNTGDYAKFEGHYYSDKAPGPSFLGVPVYAAFRPILRSAPMQALLLKVSQTSAFQNTLNEEGSGLGTAKVEYFVSLMVVAFFITCVPSALLGVFLFDFLTLLGLKRTWSLVVVLTFSFATNAFAFSSVFFSHQLVAFCLFTAFYLAFRIHRGLAHPAWVVLSGFLLGLAVISEYPSALIALGIFAYTFSVLKKSRWLVGFVAAGVPPGALMMAYNWAIFRTPLPVGYEYSELYTDVHSTGFLSITYPHPEALWGLTFGSFRGLFFSAPVLLLGVAGFIVWWKRKQFHAEWLVSLWAVLSFYLFYASSVMWNGGYAVGPRYLVPMLPFLTLAAGIFADQFGAKTWAKITYALLAVLSWLNIWAQTFGGQSFPDWTLNPLFNYSIPNLLAGNVARNWGMVLGLRGISSILPLLLIIALGTGLLFYPLRKRDRRTP